MPDRELKLHDSGAEVIEAQNLLNRSGGILDSDGGFGKGTETAVREFQAAAGLPGTGIIDAATWQRLRALPEPSPDIPTRAVAFIAREEVGGRAYYDTQCMRPTWPGGARGVTIGVGYDLGYQSGFAAHWSDVLTPAQVAALRPWLGVKGQAAAAGPAQLMGITIPWHAAWMAYTRRTLPQEIAATRATFTGPVSMRPLCLGVPVSLVYNRGTAMNDTPGYPGSRKEMRDIRDAIAARRLADIPGALIAMKRLWPEGNGPRGRRDREAKLFEEGPAQ
jgi:putative peptidoglycan binding protein